VLKERGKTFKYMNDCGLQPILIRVDSQRALAVGAELGVDTFQGFLIDDDMRKHAA
jgi:EAL domain-containing protein (putative c-di-GMP-specific phosphodiesterase class I)